MDWHSSFPQFGRSDLRLLYRSIDSWFLGLTRAYGDTLEMLFSPLSYFLSSVEHLLTNSPWYLVLAAIVFLSWLASKSLKIAASVLIVLSVIGVLGMWEDTMKTAAMIVTSTLVSIVIGMPIGILMARSSRLQSIINPLLDIMQTMPSFVYLIPVVMMLGIGRVPGLIAVVIYAMPPIIRLTNLGIRQVDEDVLEAADSFGVSSSQKLFKVQIPLALPTIMAGINQTIMMALAMVVIASMIGVQGLGQPVLKAISNQYFSMGLFNGFAIVGLAILLDRVSQALGSRLQKHRGN